MSTLSEPEVTLERALNRVAVDFRSRLIKSYRGLKTAYLESNFDACGLRAGRFCEVLLRWLQQEVTGSYTPFGTKIGNFKNECSKLENTTQGAGHESLRVLIPRALSFLYTLRNKRGIGHESGDVDANEIDAATAVRMADWCVSELVRLLYSVSLEEAQAICDAIAERQIPQVWEVFGKKRVLVQGLSYSDKTLLLLYSSADSAVPAEDLFAWTEHSHQAIYRRDVLRQLHEKKYAEYDRDTQMVAISPVGSAKVEKELLRPLLL